MELKILNKEPLTLPQIEKVIAGLGKKEERAEIQNKIYDTAKKYAKLSEEDALKLMEELKELNIATLAPEQLSQIAEFVPQDLGELKSVLASSKITLPPETFNKIRDILSKYKK